MTDTEIEINNILKETFWEGRSRATKSYCDNHITRILALLQQSNREYGNWLIGLDELPQVLSSDPEKSIHPEVRNELRAKLRKKNAE